jgi:hypothetical protein
MYSANTRRHTLPLFFFSSRDSQGDNIDTGGTKLADIAEARRQGIALMGQMIKDSAGHRDVGAKLDVWIANASGDTLCSFSFSES